MKDITGRQAIGCKVTSCSHNQGGAHCALAQIDVMPCSSMSSGNPADESMCASYDGK